MLSAFGSRTSRNQPSTSNIFLARRVGSEVSSSPHQGGQSPMWTGACKSWAIAGRVSGHAAMQAAYQSGDFYLHSPRWPGPHHQGLQRDPRHGP